MEKCDICLENDTNLAHTEEIRVKLSACVPELDSQAKILCLRSFKLFKENPPFEGIVADKADGNRPVAELQITNSSDFLLNAKFEEENQEFICFNCNEKFPQKETLIKHFTTAHSDTTKTQQFQCPKCPSNFSTKYLLNRHVKNVHAALKRFDCDTCGQKFASSVYLSAHKRYHSRDRSHICTACGKGFITASDLYHHQKIHANKRSYKCDKCPKAFNTSSDLHKHNICVHTDKTKWKYVCRFCDKRFPLKTNMDNHVKIHTGERNFACHVCEKRFIVHSLLLRHIETHSNVCQFCCETCGREYKYRKSLDIHMKKAHGIGNAKIPERTKRYICHVCPKGYYTNSKLQKHLAVHIKDG